MIFAIVNFGNAQNCKKFINYQTKDIDVGSIKMSLGLGAGSGETEPTKIKTVMRNASEKLQQLDLIQFNLCNQLKSIKSESIKEKLSLQANNVITKMLNLQSEAEAGGTTAEVETKTTTKSEELAITKEPVRENNEIVSGTTTTTEKPQTVIEEKDEDIEIVIPCGGEAYYSTDDIIRGTGEGWSMDAQMAKRGARTAALEDLAAKIEITVKTLCEDYQLSKKNGLDETFIQQLENKTATVVNQTISGWKTVCEKMKQNTKTKNYTAYTAVEISVKQILNGTYAQLKADQAIAKQLPPKEEFDKKFNEIMGEVEQSNEMMIPEF
jgi:hypothetical protein